MDSQNSNDEPFWVLEDGVWLDNAPVGTDSIVISDSVVMGDVVQKIIIDNPEKVQEILKNTLESIGFSDGKLPINNMDEKRDQISNTISLADYISSFGVDFNGWTELSLGYACEAKGDIASAKSHFSQALEFGKKYEDERLQLHSELGFIVLLINEEKYNQAEDRSVVLLNAFIKQDDDEGISNCKELLGLISYSKGNYKLSRAHHEEALQIRQSKGNTEAVISSKINLANVAMSEGKINEAGNLLNALDINYINKKDEAQLLCSRGVNELQNENFHESINLLKQSLEIRQEISDKRGESESYNYIGTAKMLYGKIESGYTDCETAYSIAKEIENNNLMAHALYNMGQGSFGLDNTELGWSELSSAAKLFREIGNFEGAKNCDKMLNQINKKSNINDNNFVVYITIIVVLLILLAVRLFS